MLQLLRGKKSGLFVKIALVLITIGFSFFGIESYFVSTTNTSVAKVGKTEISQDQFRDSLNRARQSMIQQTGGALDASYFERPEVKQQILERMINEKLLLNANESLGITVPATRLREEIMAIPAFQVDGQFNQDQYRAALASQGMTPVGFEERVREEMSLRELPLQVGSTALVTDAQVDTYLRLKDQQRDFRYIKLDKPAAQNTDVAADEIEAYYKAHSGEFMVPERVALDYLELDASKLNVNLTPDDATLKERYEKEKARFISNEERLASHILIKVGGKGSPDEQKQALAKAEEIEKQLKEGKDFAALAKQDSADLGSKAQGGDLGWLDKGTTDEAFETALFALNKGEVSAPVLTSEGYHIIQLRDIRPGKTRSFEEVKPELAKEFADSERERVYSEKAGKLTDLAYQDPSSLEGAAKQLDLKVQKTALFARQGGAEGLAANPAVVKAAFSDAVLVQNNNSDPIDLGANHIVVVRVAEHKPATPIPLDEVRDQVRGKIIAERTSKEAKAHADALFAELGKGETLDQLASAQKLKVEEQKGIGRDAANVDGALVKAAFEMPRPQDKPGTRLVDLGGDAYALIELVKVVDGDPSKLDAKTKEAARNTLAEGSGSEAVREFLAALRRDTKITVSESRMQEL
jgi:peptidyl-prolyl cis-trans isomerase D